MANSSQWGVRAGIATLIWLSSVLAAVAQQGGEVARADRMSPAVTRYSRVTPQIAAAGLLREGALAELKSLGFAMVIDLRGPDEGAEHERRSAAMVALRYENIPVTAEIPADAQIVAFARLVEDAGNHPLLVHCASASRVGAMWALYRAARGVPFDVALAEARAIGLQGARERAVRERIAKPPFTK
jgi:uncharacterized protein (TIGR01244 family)